MKKCTACAFSSTRKDRRPKKCTMPPIACSMACHALGGGGGGLAGSNGAPAHKTDNVSTKTVYMSPEDANTPGLLVKITTEQSCLFNTAQTGHGQELQRSRVAMWMDK